jgi:hypothetical protein
VSGWSAFRPRPEMPQRACRSPDVTRSRHCGALTKPSAIGAANIKAPAQVENNLKQMIFHCYSILPFHPGKCSAYLTCVAQTVIAHGQPLGG